MMVLMGSHRRLTDLGGNVDYYSMMTLSTLPTMLRLKLATLLTLRYTACLAAGLCMHEIFLLLLIFDVFPISHSALHGGSALSRVTQVDQHIFDFEFYYKLIWLIGLIVAYIYELIPSKTIRGLRKKSYHASLAFFVYLGQQPMWATPEVIRLNRVGIYHWPLPLVTIFALWPVLIFCASLWRPYVNMGDDPLWRTVLTRLNNGARGGFDVWLVAAGSDRLAMYELGGVLLADAVGPRAAKAVRRFKVPVLLRADVDRTVAGGIRDQFQSVGADVRVVPVKTPFWIDAR